MENESMEKNFGIFRKSSPIRIEPLSDARISELNTALGMAGGISVLDFATSDIEEIMFRQEVAMWLMLPGMKEFAESLRSRLYCSDTMPNQDRKFIDYYSGLKEDKTDFWLRLQAFLDFIGPENGRSMVLPFRILEVLNEIDQNSKIFRAKEDDLADRIMNSMRSMVSIEGILEFNIDTHSWRKGRDVVDSKKIKDVLCFGVRKYDPNLDGPARRIDLPWWTGKPGRKLKDYVNGLLRERRLGPSRINKTPDQIINDITSYLNRLFRNNQTVPDDEVNALSIEVAYQLDTLGLNVQIIGWKIGVDVKGTPYGEKTDDVRCLDFGEDYGHRKVEKYAKEVAESRTNIIEARKRYAVGQWLGDVSKNVMTIDSAWTSSEFCLSHFKTVFASYEKEVKEIKEWQARIEKTFDDIIFLYGIIEKMCKTGVPSSLPEFAENCTFEFRDIYPIRLSLAKKEILPFNAFSANGRIVNLTGRNGSGKTTLEVSMLDVILMAMSGFPVPAMEAKIPVVETILLSFLDRELGRSTFQAKIEKDTNNAKIISKMPPAKRSKVILITDEVGSATTEESVLPLVEKYMKWINSQDVSVVMSTQAPELSRFIGDELKGINLIIKKEEEKNIYELYEGIGEGDPAILAQKAGLFDIIGPNN